MLPLSSLKVGEAGVVQNYRRIGGLIRALLPAPCFVPCSRQSHSRTVDTPMGPMYLNIERKVGIRIKLLKKISKKELCLYLRLSLPDYM